jgi:two-component system NarL family response regulator
VIRLLLADDHAIVRESLREILAREPDLDIVGEAGDGHTALALAHELVPDILMTDISMPGLDGVALAQRMRQECPGVKVLALSSHLDRRILTNMLDAGALGYVNKAAGRIELLSGIRAVASGNRFMCQQCAAMLMAKPAQSSAEAVLGRREIEVLKLIAIGLTSAAISEKLFIAQGTVEVHRRNILRKLDQHNIAGLTQYAIREGLISV